MFTIATTDGQISAASAQLANLVAAVVQSQDPVEDTWEDAMSIDLNGETTATPSIPRQPVRDSGPDRLTLSVELPAQGARAQAALDLLAGFSRRRNLPAGLAERWLHGAQPLLGGPEALWLCAQHDEVSEIVTVELWSGGARVFGIDDWVGW